MMKGVPFLNCCCVVCTVQEFHLSNEERQGLKVSFLDGTSYGSTGIPLVNPIRNDHFQVEDVQKQTWGPRSKSLPMKCRDFRYPQSSVIHHSLPFTRSLEVGNMGRLFLIYIHLQPWRIFTAGSPEKVQPTGIRKLI